MTKEKRLLYQKAYVELYEMIKHLSDEEREKIPEYFIEYLYNNMDTNIINLAWILKKVYQNKTIWLKQKL